MIIYISFNSRTGKTARNLRSVLAKKMPQHEVRRIRRGKRFLKRADVLLQWGDASSNPQVEPSITMNKRLANASNKLQMIRKLKEGNISTPEFVESTDGTYTMPVFIRNCNDQVEFRDFAISGDRYATAPIDKVNEYRVHIFMGKLVGVYKKIPNEGEEGIIRKNSNCHFSRIEEPSDRIGKLAIEATRVLELDFSGVDILEDIEGNLFVNEVNSAPSLNNPNLERFGELFKDYININS